MTPEQMKPLWRLLAQTWGSKFTEQFGPTPNDAWTLGLERIELPAVRAAFSAFIQGGSAFPPTLPEFIAACRKAERQLMPVLSDALPADTPVVDFETARENIRRLRALVRGATKDVG